MFPLSTATNQIWAIIQVILGIVAFMTNWREGRNAWSSIGDDSIEIFKYVNASVFIISGVYTFASTFFSNLNAYVLTEPIAFFILQDPYSSIISAFVSIIAASVTLTSVLLDPKIMLSK